LQKARERRGGSTIRKKAKNFVTSLTNDSDLAQFMGCRSFVAWDTINEPGKGESDKMTLGLGEFRIL
jgi:hypothetical protein